MLHPVSRTATGAAGASAQELRREELPALGLQGGVRSAHSSPSQGSMCDGDLGQASSLEELNVLGLCVPLQVGGLLS